MSYQELSGQTLRASSVIATQLTANTINWTTFNPPLPSGGAQNLEEVLTEGADGGGLSMTNLNEITCDTLHYTTLDPPIGPGGAQNLEEVLAEGNDANNLDIVGVDSLGCSSVTASGAINCDTLTAAGAIGGASVSAADVNCTDLTSGGTINWTAFSPSLPVPDIGQVLAAGVNADAYDLENVNDLTATTMNCDDLTVGNGISSDHISTNTLSVNGYITYKPTPVVSSSITTDANITLTPDQILTGGVLYFVSITADRTITFPSKASIESYLGYSLYDGWSTPPVEIKNYSSTNSLNILSAGYIYRPNIAKICYSTASLIVSIIYTSGALYLNTYQSGPVARFVDMSLPANQTAYTFSIPNLTSSSCISACFSVTVSGRPLISSLVPSAGSVIVYVDNAEGVSRNIRFVIMRF